VDSWRGLSRRRFVVRYIGGGHLLVLDQSVSARIAFPPRPLARRLLVRRASAARVSALAADRGHHVLAVGSGARGR